MARSGVGEVVTDVIFLFLSVCSLILCFWLLMNTTWAYRLENNPLNSISKSNTRATPKSSNQSDNNSGNNTGSNNTGFNSERELDSRNTNITFDNNTLQTPRTNNNNNNNNNSSDDFGRNISLPHPSSSNNESPNKITASHSLRSQQSVRSQNILLNQIETFIRRITLLTLFFYALCCLVSVIGLFYKIIFEINENEERSTKSIAIIKFINMAFLVFAVVFMFILFIGRIYFTFRGTIYAYNENIIYSLFIYFSCEIILFIIIVILWSFDQILYVLIFWLILIVLHTLFSILILYLFIHKLMKLISTHNSVHSKNRFNNNKNNGKNEKYDSKLFQSVARSTMLTTMSIVVTSIAMIIQATFFAYGLPDDWINENSAMFFLISIDNAINTLTIYLNTKFANKWYDILCSCCLRNCCETWLAKKTDEIDKDERNLSEIVA